MRRLGFHGSAVFLVLLGAACGFSGVGTGADVVDRPDGTVLGDGAVLPESGAADGAIESGGDAETICVADKANDPLNCGACGHVKRYRRTAEASSWSREASRRHSTSPWTPSGSTGRTTWQRAP